MLVTTMQPQFFAPLYWVERLARCHRVVTLEESQFSRVHMQALLMTKNGEQKLTVPVGKGKHSPMTEVELSGPEAFCEKTLTTLHIAYRKCAHFENNIGEIEHFLTENLRKGTTVAEFGRACQRFVIEYLDLGTEEFRSRDLLAERLHPASAWLAKLAEEAEAKFYMQGRNSMNNYFEPEYFLRSGVGLYCQSYLAQYQAKGFAVSHATHSWIDFLFKLGRPRLQSLIGLHLGKGIQSPSVEVWGGQ